MTVGVNIKLHDGTTPQASLSGLTCLWWDSEEVYELQSPQGRTEVATTTVDGDLILDLSEVSGHSVGGVGYLLVRKEDATPEDSLVFQGKITTVAAAGGTLLEFVPDWARPDDWLELPTVGASEEKFVGLMAITNDDSNFAALLARGAYTVDWGDGTVEDIADNVQAEHLYDYAAISAGTLSSRGYKQVIITVTPQTGSDLTLININRKHTQVGLVNSYETGWLDIELGSPNFGTGASIQIGLTTVRKYWLERVRIANPGGMTSASNLFRDCPGLQSVPLFDTSSVTPMNTMFLNCASLQQVPLFNTSIVENMNAMFNGCTSLKQVPLFNTAIVENMASMFFGCTSLQQVPLFDTSSVTDMNQMLRNCTSLQQVPLFDTSLVTIMNNMFQLCIALQSVPLFNTALVENMSVMFHTCSALQSIPALDCSAVTSAANFGSTFVNNNSLSSMKATGINYSFSLLNAKLSAAALDEVYTNLPTVVGQTITVTGNWGTADHDPTIATGKGWTVTA